KSSTELTFDLVFDTADEAAGGGKARSVREKTLQVEQFVVPASDPTAKGKRLTPPRVRFQWGDLTIDGVISSLNLEMDLFAKDGTPLRAKMAVSIKEQDAKYEYKKGKEGANQGEDPTPGAKGSGAAGHSGGGKGAPTDSSAPALAGESAADFARRMGLDPAAWRSFAAP